MSELEKHADAVPSMRVIGDFLDWCEEQKIELAVPTPSGRWLQPHNEGREATFQRYFGIDANKLENERRALLAKAAKHSPDISGRP